MLVMSSAVQRRDPVRVGGYSEVKDASVDAAEQGLFADALRSSEAQSLLKDAGLSIAANTVIVLNKFKTQVVRLSDLSARGGRRRLRRRRLARGSVVKQTCDSSRTAVSSCTSFDASPMQDYARLRPCRGQFPS